MSGTRQRGASVTIPIRTEGAATAERDLQRVGESGDRALRQITLSAGLAQRALGLLGPVLAGVSAGALLVFARNAINAAGSIGEIAEQIGVTTDALQVLRFGAVQSGVSMEELDRALAALTRTIADAEQGSGDAAERFSRFGIAFRDAGGNVRATEAILGDISDAMAALESPTERASLATAIFGDRLGQRLIPLLVGGRDALGEFERQARATGQVLDGETVAAARAASDNMAALQATFETFSRNLAVNVVPVLQQVLGLINRLVFGAPVAQQVAERRAALAVLEGRIAELRDEANAPAAPLPNLGRGAQNRADMLRTGRADAIAAGIRELEAERAGLVLELNRLAEQEREQRARAAETFGDRPTGRDVSFIPPPAPATPSEAGAGTRGGGGARGGLDVAAVQQRIINDVLRDREAIVRANITPAEQYAERMERLGRVVESLAGTPDALDAIQINREAVAAAEEYERALGRVGEQQDSLRDAARDFSDAIGTAFEDAILSGKRWQDVLKGILQDIARIVLRLTVTGPLQSGLTSLLGGILGTPARAMGGPVTAGRAYRVGEFGPETFVPTSSGRIEPGGGGVTVNLSIGVGVAQTVQAEIRNMLPSITRAVQSAVADRAQRGGGYAAAVRG